LTIFDYNIIFKHQYNSIIYYIFFMAICLFKHSLFVKAFTLFILWFCTILLRYINCAVSNDKIFLFIGENVTFNYIQVIYWETTGDDNFVHPWFGQRWCMITPPCNHVIHNCATRPCTRDNCPYENSITLSAILQRGCPFICFILVSTLKSHNLYSIIFAKFICVIIFKN